MIKKSLKGLDATLRTLAKIPDIVAGDVRNGMIDGGKFLQRQSQLIVPVLTGKLKNSAFTRASGTGFLTEVRVGYVANYAIYVHENLEARHKPGKVAKFLESPLRVYGPQILEIIRKRATRRFMGGK